MSQSSDRTVPSRRESGGREPAVGTAPSSLADILDRILDKGIVIVGDIQINLLDIELLTIKIRLLVASVDRAREMGIDWWEHDPSLSSKARDAVDENERLRRQIAELERDRDEARRGEELEEEPESEEYEDEELGEEPEEELAEEPEEEPEEET
ncbi:gas vesicle protein [Streptomyces montanus]|uniref:Gas vesicle protein n=1 Tax=Streptomyces montanus TaxID=2580423 RepID=A0A5R9FR19_9ACTN|nr:gas vesicle protein [Streptomyces montanus]TLS44536.1 gas vesicle protein [Streptomyces montanus]